MTETWLRVGEVARRTGLTIRTLHHYDELGLLVPSGRSSGDHRLYSDADLRRLLSIQQLKSLGMSLAAVAAALDDPAFDARTALDQHIVVVQARIAEERELLARLRSLRDASSAGWSEVLDLIALTERLRHPDSSIRVRAALEAPATVPVDALISHLLTEPEPAVRETLTWAIARHGQFATAPLVRRLGSPDAAVRLQVLHVLSKLADPDASAWVAPLLADGDEEVAAKAAFTLGQIGGSEAVTALAGVLGTEGERLPEAITRALAGLGSAAAEAVRPALESPGPRTRTQAADVLGLLGDEGAVDALIGALRDTDAAVRFAALLALGQIGTSDALDAIAGAAVSGDARVRLLARRLLADRGAGAPPR